MKPSGSMDACLRAREIFLAALDQPDAPARARFVAAACGDDPALRQEVERLLEDHFAPDIFMAAPAGGELRARPSAEGPGTVIGRYRLLEQIGEGGMGVVFMAEQREPVARRVALKVIKLGLDTRSVIARFEAERQALALMDHPHIAKVLDAGATESGRPYFVMELVQGVPLTDFCARNKLTVAERLRLFLPVCHAVQHAHQKGVIHRDLKPSNILVTQSHGAPHPLIIDFGVAKATQQRLTEKTIFTNFGTLIGTPAYMSPEQAEPDHEDVDTRSDLYSLGVLLYELLTGTTPFLEQRLRSAGLGEMLRILREEEPERPSTRLTNQHARGAATGSAAAGPSRPSELDPDLDWIVMKCLEKDRRRRYETVNGLAADLQRHLANEPVTARPPSAAYRLQKALRRHRFAFAAGAAVGVALLLGLALATWQAVRATRAERAQAVQLERAERAEKAATDELWRSLLATAKASRSSGAPGRRLDSLEAIRRASGLRPSLELRNEAIAALALTDLGPAHLGQDTPWVAARRQGLEVAFDADLRRVALLAEDGSIHVHRVDDHQPLLHIPAARGEVEGSLFSAYLRFSPDGRFLAGRFENGDLRCWELEPFRLTLDTRIEGWGFAMTFSPDSRLLLAGRVPGELVCFASLPSPGGAADREPDWQMMLGVFPKLLDFNPAGTRLAVMTDGAVQVWDWPARTLTRQFNSAGVWWLAWHPDGEHLCLSLYDGSLQIWHGPNSRHFRGPTEVVARIATHPLGELMATHSWSGTTRLWNLTEEGPQLATSEGLALGFSRDGSRLGFVHGSRRYGYWPVSPSRILRTLAGASNSREFGSLDFSPDGTVLIWADSFGLWSLDLARGRYRHLRPGVSQARLSADGNALILGNGEGLKRQPIVWERTALETRLRWAGPAEPIAGADFPVAGSRLSVNERRQFLATERSPGSTLGPRVVLGNETGPSRRFTSPLASDVFSASLSPDARWLALGHYLGPSGVLSAQTGELVRSWPELNTVLVTFTPDGQWLVTATSEEYRFWRTGTWEPGRRLARGSQLPGGGPLAFSPDQKLMATVEGWKVIRLHDAITGEMVAALESPTAEPLYALAFSPAGSLLAAIGTSRVQLWDLAEIRRELRDLNLDWDHAPLPAASSIGELPLRFVSEE